MITSRALPAPLPDHIGVSRTAPITTAPRVTTAARDPICVRIRPSADGAAEHAAVISEQHEQEDDPGPLTPPEACPQAGGGLVAGFGDHGGPDAAEAEPGVDPRDIVVRGRQEHRLDAAP